MPEQTVVSDLPKQSPNKSETKTKEPTNATKGTAIVHVPNEALKKKGTDGTRRATSTSLRHGRGFESWGRHPKGQINKWPHKTLRCPASPRRLKPRYPDTRAKKADVFVGTSFVCLALVSRTTGTSRNGPDQSGLPRIRTQVHALRTFSVPSWYHLC